MGAVIVARPRLHRYSFLENCEVAQCGDNLYGHARAMIDLKQFEALDTREISSFIFHPRREWTPAPHNASDHSIPTHDNATLVCRFYSVTRGAPSVLFFHGNGEIACDYDWIAPMFSEMQLNLFVVDYRGYGASSGAPCFTAMLADAEVVFSYFCEMLELRGYDSDIFLMGRSLGSTPAIMLAHDHADVIKGLVVESGFGSPSRLLAQLGMPLESDKITAVEKASSQLVKNLSVPILLLHGVEDNVVPYLEAERLNEEIGSTEKTLIPIHRAGHNNILTVGEYRYFWALDNFVAGKTKKTQ